MTPDQLRQAGEILFGTRWQTALSRELGTTDRTVRRWLSGKHPIPAWAERSIKRLHQSSM